ncbi:hypothetical protein [Bartonella taylorii]|nr:hypothetical protein [Bartonella taylorii]
MQVIDYTQCFLDEIHQAHLELAENINLGKKPYPFPSPAAIK